MPQAFLRGPSSSRKHAWERNSLSVRFKVFNVMKQVAVSKLHAMTQMIVPLKATTLHCDGIFKLLTT